MKDNMMWCNDCKQAVEAKTVEERQTEDPHGRETFDICPLCGGGDLYEVAECESCGKEMRDSGEDYCEDCKADAFKEIKSMIDASKYPRKLFDELLARMLEG